MSTLYLMRHGQASFGAENYDKLSPLGCEQAKVLGEHLQKTGLRFDAVYSGNLQRQNKTAQLALAAFTQAPEINVDARFNEIDNDGQVEHYLPQLREQNATIKALAEKGFSESKDYQKLIDAVFNAWVRDDSVSGSIQSWADYSSALYAALDAVISKHDGGKTVAVFTSGGTIAILVAKALGFGGEMAYRFYEPLMNCSITRLFYSAGRVSLSSFNDTSYLAAESVARQESLLTYR